MIDPIENLIEIARLKGGTSLNLNQKSLNTLPNSLTNFTNLVYLYLESNHLTSLPDSLGNLTNLRYLNIGENQIDRLPESITNLSKLNGLWLVGNPLRDFSILQKLPNLQFVRFIGNGYFYRRYWASFDEWHPLWLSDREKEKNRILTIVRELERNRNDDT